MMLDLATEGARIRGLLSRGRKRTDTRARHAMKAYLDAMQLQSSDRLLELEGGTVRFPFLLRAIVRRQGTGEIRLVLAGKWEVTDTHLHTRIFPQGVLLVPGMQVRVTPSDAILLGSEMTPASVLEWYARYGAAWGPCYRGGLLHGVVMHDPDAYDRLRAMSSQGGDSAP